MPQLVGAILVIAALICLMFPSSHSSSSEF